MEEDVAAPVRLCCFQRHFGVQCPDGKVMCELCYDRFDVEDLNVTEDGCSEDVCKSCVEADRVAMRVVNRIRVDKHTFARVGSVPVTIRVLRLMEYEYESAEDMVRDMAKWTVQGTMDCGGGRIVRSVNLPPTVTPVSTGERRLVLIDDLPWPPPVIRDWVKDKTVLIDDLRNELIQWVDRLA